MNDKKKKQAIDLILMRLVSYYQAEITPDVIDLYSESLSDYPIERIKKAATQHVKTSKWFPKISELVELAKDHMPQIESLAETQAALVINRIRSEGYRALITWEDPVTSYLFQRRFNWKSLCNTLTEDENKWFIKEFKEAYRGAIDMCGGDVKQLGAPSELLQLAGSLFKSIN